MIDNRERYCVVIAGGNGERLWPLSRHSKPKQLLTIDDKKTLLDQAIERVRPLVPEDNIWICTTQKYEEAIAANFLRLNNRLIIEPVARNTGPAILLSCLKIYEQNPAASILFLPADSFIPSHDSERFVQYLEHVFDAVAQEKGITILGVKPTFAATGYGYIEYIPDGYAPYRVSHFHEKPSQFLAQQYVELPNMLWNIGMFCAPAKLFIDEFKQHASAMYQGVMDFYCNKSSYQAIIAQSIDYAVIEKSKNISVMPVDFSWCDVGTLETFLSIKQQSSVHCSSKVVAVESGNNLVDVPDKLVALVGVDNICIVETEHVLLIAKRDDTEKIRMVVKQLKQGVFADYL